MEKMNKINIQISYFLIAFYMFCTGFMVYVENYRYALLGFVLLSFFMVVLKINKDKETSRIKNRKVTEVLILTYALDSKISWKKLQQVLFLLEVKAKEDKRSLFINSSWIYSYNGITSPTLKIDKLSYALENIESVKILKQMLKVLSKEEQNYVETVLSQYVKLSEVELNQKVNQVSIIDKIKPNTTFRLDQNE